MKFIPFSKKYIYAKDTLTEHFPDYMKPSIVNWFHEVFRNNALLEEEHMYRNLFITQRLQHFLQIEFRELFPRKWDDFLSFAFENSDRACNVIALCLQNFAYLKDANKLEYILSQGGSAYEVTITNKEANEYEKGAYNLIMRVPTIVKSQAKEALTSNEILEEAWGYCYSRSPDYEKVVSRCSDFLEGFLKAKYFPKDPKPQLTKYVHDFENDSSKLSFKGDTIVSPKSMLTSLLREASNLRGQHILGKGRKPTKDESEFVLHTTILIWNMHYGIA